FLQQTLEQFKLELHKQLQRRLYAELENDPNALFRMLEGVQRYTRWMATSLMNRKDAIHPALVEQWQQFYRDIVEAVRGTIRCPHAVNFSEPSHLSTGTQAEDAAPRFLGAMTVQNQI